MKVVMWFDDKRDCPNPHWIWCKNFVEAMDFIYAAGLPEHICFDHDIQFDESGMFMTGMDLAKEIVNLDLNGRISIPENFTYSIQSSNSAGRDNIRSLLDGYMRHKYGHSSAFKESPPKT